MTTDARIGSGPGLPPALPLRKFSVAEYHRLGEAGILAEDDRVELLDGCIVRKMIHKPRHDATIARSNNALRRRLPDGWDVRVQSAMTTDDSEPEPDLAVVRGPEDRYAARHPGASDIALLIEVADFSLAHDREFKGPLYARAGVREYWIVNLVDDRVEVCSQPDSRRSRFSSRRDHGPGEVIPLVMGGRKIADIPVEEFLVR